MLHFVEARRLGFNMKYFTCVLFFILLLFSIGVANAGTAIVLSPDGGHSNQNQINDALKNGNAYLNAGIYEIDGPIYIYPDRKLTLDPNAIIRVWKGSSQFFTGRTGLINCVGVPKNIEISGGEIDGNCDELPSNYHSNDQDPHDCERAIFLIGSSNDYGENIYIHDIKIYDTFSDGLHVRFSTRVKIENVFESNCQHEGIYFCVVLDGLIYNCEIAGITSDNIRIENSKRIKVDKCLLYSYTGDHNNGAYKGGEAGIQIGDQGRSFGVGSDKPVHTSDIEVCNTIFANNGRTAVALDIAGKEPSDNVYFHHNQFIGAEELETMGISVEGFDFDNMPSKEMSETIFSSIFDILDIELSETGNVTQGEITPEESWQNGGKYTDAYIYLAGYEGEITIGNEKYIPESPDKCAIVYTNTKNLASKPDGQTSTLKLSTGKNNTLECKLTVKTTYRVRTNKTVTVGGKTIKNPIKEYKNKSETVVFTKTFDAPKQFPAVKAPKVYVTYYNGSHAIVEIPDVPGIVKTDISINRSSAREYRLIGEVGTAVNGFRSTRFDKVSTWKYSGSQMSMSQSGLYIKEPFDIDQLHISVTTPYKKMEVTDIEYVVIEDESSKFLNVGLLTLIVLCLTYGRAIYKIIIMVVGKYL